MLHPALTISILNTLGLGDRGEAVRIIQEQLILDLSKIP